MFVAATDRRRCWSGEFTCRSGQCVRPATVCDGRPDCHDGTDEQYCEDRYAGDFRPGVEPARLREGEGYEYTDWFFSKRNLPAS